MALADRVLGFGKIIASKVVNKVVLLSVRGVGAVSDSDEDAEGSAEEPAFGQLGVVARPRPQNVEGAVEHIAARLEDSLMPLAMRDLRQSARFPNPKEGDAALVNDNGSFVSCQDGADRVTIVGHPRAGLPKSCTVTAYCPKLDDSGAVTAAHAVTMDSSVATNMVAVVHALGMALVFTKDGEVVVRSDTGEARILLKGDQITFQAAKIVCQGNVVIGGNPVGAVPFAGGPSMVPCPSLFLSLV